MGYIDKSLVAQRLDSSGRLSQLPGTLERWTLAKLERDISSEAPHVVRFNQHLDVARQWALDYSDFTFRVVTQLRAWMDAPCAQEEPAAWAAKKAKKTWDGIYPERFKLSDIDLNVYLAGAPLTHREIAMLLYRDPLRLPQCTNILDFPRFRLDVYPDKGEPGFAL